MTSLPSARAGLWRTLVDDGFALAIVAACVALAWIAAGILAVIIAAVERITA
jgi:hypothetical protein